MPIRKNSLAGREKFATRFRHAFAALVSHCVLFFGGIFVLGLGAWATKRPATKANFHLLCELFLDFVDSDVLQSYFGDV